MSLLWRTAAVASHHEAAAPIPSKSQNLDRHLHGVLTSGFATPPHQQTLEEFGGDRRSMWHGSPNGVAGMKVAPNGLHVGTQEAARQALNARIGTRADGKDWDGTQEYGKTLLAGRGWFRDRGQTPTGESSRNKDEGNYYPTGTATYGLGKDSIPLDVKPHLFPVRIIGGMTNSPHDPHPDWHANGYMSAQIKRGRARNGYYYKNIGEDSGSISAVVPSADHLATHEDFVRHVHQQVSEHNAKGGAPHFLTGTIHPENLERYGLEAP